MMPPLGSTLSPSAGSGSPGTRARTPGPSGDWVDDALSVPRRTNYVRKALFRAGDQYIGAAIATRLGADFRAVVSGLLAGLVIALGVMVGTTLAGAAIGGGVGALAGGVGAAPGAAAGARIGSVVGQWLLEWIGLGFLVVYMATHLGEVAGKFGRATSLAWNSEGQPAAIDAAAREFADGVGTFFSLLVQALVLYITKAAGEGKFNTAMRSIRGSRLFRQAAGMEAWLGANYARFRAKYVPLTWKVLTESAERIPNTTVPNSMRLKVGGRVFDIDRNAAKLVDGKSIGPATKHMGEVAKDASGLAKIHQTDFPISSLAAALDQAEAQLLFRPPSSAAKPLKLDHWELILDTTGPIWRVYHANYTSKPKW